MILFLISLLVIADSSSINYNLNPLRITLRAEHYTYTNDILSCDSIKDISVLNYSLNFECNGHINSSDIWSEINVYISDVYSIRRVPSLETKDLPFSITINTDTIYQFLSPRGINHITKNTFIFQNNSTFNIKLFFDFVLMPAASCSDTNSSDTYFQLLQLTLHRQGFVFRCEQIDRIIFCGKSLTFDCVPRKNQNSIVDIFINDIGAIMTTSDFNLSLEIGTSFGVDSGYINLNGVTNQVTTNSVFYLPSIFSSSTYYLVQMLKKSSDVSPTTSEQSSTDLLIMLSIILFVLGTQTFGIVLILLYCLGSHTRRERFKRIFSNWNRLPLSRNLPTVGPQNNPAIQASSVRVTTVDETTEVQQTGLDLPGPSIRPEQNLIRNSRDIVVEKEDLTQTELPSEEKMEDCALFASASVFSKEPVEMISVEVQFPEVAVILMRETVHTQTTSADLCLVEPMIIRNLSFSSLKNGSFYANSTKDISEVACQTQVPEQDTVSLIVGKLPIQETRIDIEEISQIKVDKKNDCSNTSTIYLNSKQVKFYDPDNQNSEYIEEEEEEVQQSPLRSSSSGASSPMKYSTSITEPIDLKWLEEVIHPSPSDANIKIQDHSWKESDSQKERCERCGHNMLPYERLEKSINDSPDTNFTTLSAVTIPEDIVKVELETSNNPSQNDFSVPGALSVKKLLGLPEFGCDESEKESRRASKPLFDNHPSVKEIHRNKSYVQNIIDIFNNREQQDQPKIPLFEPPQSENNQKTSEKEYQHDTLIEENSCLVTVSRNSSESQTVDQNIPFIKTPEVEMNKLQRLSQSTMNEIQSQNESSLEPNSNIVSITPLQTDSPCNSSFEFVPGNIEDQFKCTNPHSSNEEQVLAVDENRESKENKNRDKLVNKTQQTSITDTPLVRFWKTSEDIYVPSAAVGNFLEDKLNSTFIRSGNRVKEWITERTWLHGKSISSSENSMTGETQIGIKQKNSDNQDVSSPGAAITSTAYSDRLSEFSSTVGVQLVAFPPAPCGSFIATYVGKPSNKKNNENISSEDNVLAKNKNEIIVPTPNDERTKECTNSLIVHPEIHKKDDQLQNSTDRQEDNEIVYIQILNSIDDKQQDLECGSPGPLTMTSPLDEGNKNSYSDQESGFYSGRNSEALCPIEMNLPPLSTTEPPKITSESGQVQYTPPEEDANYKKKTIEGTYQSITASVKNSESSEHDDAQISSSQRQSSFDEVYNCPTYAQMPNHYELGNGEYPPESVDEGKALYSVTMKTTEKVRECTVNIIDEDKNTSDAETEFSTTSNESVDTLNELRASKVLPLEDQQFCGNVEFIYHPEKENDCHILEILPGGLENPLGWLNFKDEDFIRPIKNKKAEFSQPLPRLPIVYKNRLHPIEPINEIIDLCIPPPSDNGSGTYEYPFIWMDISDEDFNQIVYEPLQQGSAQIENDPVSVSRSNSEEKLPDINYPCESMKEFLEMFQVDND